MRTLSMFLAGGILLFTLGTPAEAATTSNAYTTATSSGATDSTVRTNVAWATLGSTCSSILVGKDKMPLAICTGNLSKASTIYLFDTTGTRILAKYAMNSSAVVGTRPAYLDDHGWLVVINGDRVIWRIVHLKYPNGTWYLGIGRSAVLTGVIGASDAVVGLQPDALGHVWFATRNGVVGIADTDYNTARAVHVKSGEQIQKDLSATPSRIVVTSTRSIYSLAATATGSPKILTSRAK